jgi:hypothetical protein
MSRFAFAARAIARALEAAQGLGMFFEKLREIGEHFHRGRAEMMFDAFDVLALRFGVEAEEGEKAGEGDVAILDFARDFPALVGHHETAVFFVLEIASFGEFLDHAGDRGLFDLERGSDINHAGVAFLLDQFMDALQVIFGALAGRKLRHVASGLNTVLQSSQGGSGRGELMS